MSKTFSLVLMAVTCAAAMFLAVPARGQVTISLVAVGDTNNAADTTVMVDTTTGYGAVSHNYSISAYDVTVAQYTAMLNAVGATDPYGLWNASMGAGDPNVGGIKRSGAFGSYTYSVIGTGTNPITNVSWLDSARFCNWLQNGQPATGVEGLFTTETGAYTLNGDITSGLETKNAVPEWWVPTEDEWYKAAYYDPTITGSGYWSFPTASNTTPGNDFLAASGSNQANFIAGGLYSVTQSATLDPNQDYLTPVGSFINSASHYGTFDQGGDVYQWNDAIISGTTRGLRGGAWDTTSSALQSNDRESRSPLTISPDIGFRVATSLSPVPVITSPLSATGTDNINFTYTITAQNNPTTYGATGLPVGLSGPSSTGVISGTPSDTGTFPVTITAGNAVGTGTANLTLVIVPFPAPTISSSLSATGSADVPFSYTITATANPTDFGATSLPPGLVVSTSNGLISGTPTQTGTFSTTISAGNTSGTGTALLAIDILSPPAPVISSTLNVTGTEGTPFNYQIAGTNGPTAFTSGTLPSGLSLDGSTGLISGTPTENGTFSTAIGAVNLGGTTTATLDITLLSPVPVITSPLSATATNGAGFTYQIAASFSSGTYGAVGLPPGLTVSGSTGLISGTLAAGGVYPVTIDAVNSSGTGSATLTITVSTNLSPLAGSYQGLVSVGGTNQGLLTMTLTSVGAFTGKVTLPTVQYPLKGTLSSLGTFAAIQADGTAILNIFLNVNANVPGVSGTLIAATNAGTATYGLQCGQLATYTAKTLPNGLAGYYTATIPGVSGTLTTLPHAPGYGVMSVSNTGAIHINGKLADGTLFNVRSQLHSNGQSWTFYTPLYGTKTPGSLAGNMTFEGLNGSDSDGTLDWIKSNGTPGYYSGGFIIGVNLDAAKYVAPALATGTGTGTLVFAGGDLVVTDTTTNTTNETLTISAKDKVTVNAAGTTVTITPATGLFSGIFPAEFFGTPSVPKEAFDGVIYLKPKTQGFGFFLGSGQSGSVTITP